MIDIISSVQKDIKELHVSSEAFVNRTYIPTKYTCDGINVNPPIEINDIPVGTKSLVLIVEDIDAPIRPWTHWIVWNIPVSKNIKENSHLGIEGMNDFRQHHYGGPCPPSGTHHYYFKVYALDTLLFLQNNSKKYDLEKAMSSHVIASGELIGLYKRAL